MFYGFVGVQAIDMEQVNATIFEVRKRLIKGFAKQGGEPCIMLIIVATDIFPNLFTILSRVFIALPSVHGIGSGGQPMLLHRLAECEIGVAGVRPEFNKQGGFDRLHNPECERDMPHP